MAKQIPQFDETTGRRIAYTEIKLREGVQHRKHLAAAKAERKVTRDTLRRFAIDLDDLLFDKDHRVKQSTARFRRLADTVSKHPVSCVTLVNEHTRRNEIIDMLTVYDARHKTAVFEVL